VKAGWLVKDKGLWSVTDEGRAAFDKFLDPLEFAQQAARLYRQWRSEQPDEEDVEQEESPGASATLEEAEESAWTEIEERLTNMPPYDFQELVAGLLRGMGYHVAWVAPPGPDRGIDVLAFSDPLGIRGPRIKVQVKRTDRIQVREVRSFMSVLSDGDVGIFVSTGGFTKDSEDEARNQERRRIMLLDLRRLFDLWVEHYDKIPETQRQFLPLKRVHFLAPTE
jgi:restriction system protein